MMLSFAAPFLIVFVLVLCAGSLYYAIENMIHSRRPKRIKSTNLNYIDFKKLFSS